MTFLETYTYMGLGLLAIVGVILVYQRLRHHL